MKLIFNSTFCFVIVFIYTFQVNGQISNNSMVFKGTNYVEVNSEQVFDPLINTAFTYEGWFKFCSDGMILSKNWCNGQAGFYFNVVNNGQIRFLANDQNVCNNGNLILLTTAQTYSPNTWYHFSLIIQTTSSTTNVQIRINNVLVLNSSASGLINNSNENLILGAYKNISGQYALPFIGEIDEFRVYSSVLTTSDLGLAVPTNSSLIVRYQMEPQGNLSTLTNLGSLGSTCIGTNLTISNSSSVAVQTQNTKVKNPSVSLGIDTIDVCKTNTAVNLNATAGAMTYKWFSVNTNTNSTQQISGSNTNQLNYTYSSTYPIKIIVEASNYSCFDRDTAIILLKSPQLFSSDTVLCSGSSLVLGSNRPVSSPQWSNGATSSTITVNQPGKYWLSATDQGCIVKDTITVTAIALPTVSLPKDTTICFGQSLTVVANSSINKYLWFNGNLSSSQVLNQSGSYWVKSVNACGSDTDTIVLTVQPKINLNLGKDTTLCQGQSITCDISNLNGSYLWENGSNASTKEIQNPGLYWVKVTQNNCSTTDSIKVTLINQPIVSLPKDTTICFGQSLTVVANSSINKYLWFNGNLSSSQVLNQSGSYWVKSVNACGSDTDTIVLTVQPKINLNLGKDTTLCQGQSITCDISNLNGSYLWENGSNASTKEIQNPGLYWVKVSQNNCSASDTIQVKFNNLPINPSSNDTTVCYGSFLTFNGVNHELYTWKKDNAIFDTPFEESGSYILESSNQCGELIDTVNIVVIDCSCEVYVPNSFTPNQDDYNNKFKVLSTCELETYHIIIFDRWGEKIFESNRISDYWDGEFNSLPVEIGTYTYQIYYSTKDFYSNQLIGKVNVIR